MRVVAPRLPLAGLLAVVLGGAACCCYTDGAVGSRRRGARRAGPEPEVRVRLSAVTASARVAADGGVVVIAGRDRRSAGPGEPVALSRAGGLRVTIGNRGPVPAADTVELRAAGEGLLEVGDRRYRGRLRAFVASDELVVVNVLPMDDYLYGVVPCEIGPITSETFEAVKAQAVAARTFTFSRFGRRKGLGHDLFDSYARDQEYRGAGSESELGRRAVDATRGEVLTWRGDIIEALYHGNCGGVTCSGDAPYLAGVRDTPGHRSGTPFCSGGKYHRWEKEFDRAEFDRGLARAAGIAAGTRISRYRPVREGNRVNKLVHETARGERTVSGFAVRMELGLRSRWFDIAVRGERVTVTGRGWGHGRGMCQDGAVEMARRGHDYRRILRHYYSGVSIEQRF